MTPTKKKPATAKIYQHRGQWIIEVEGMTGEISRGRITVNGIKLNNLQFCGELNKLNKRKN